MKYNTYYGEPMERFFNNVSVTGSECWEWTGTLSSLEQPYGQFSLRCTTILAHRFSYMVFNGNLKKGLQINHLCKNKSCVNPDHLEQVTAKQNHDWSMDEVRIAANKRKENRTSCKRGHSFLLLDNIYIKKNGARECKVCSRAYKSNWYLKNKHPIEAWL